MADKPDSKPFDLEANQDEIALFELREEVRKILPPVSEIAQLAALISHGHPIGLQTWETYAGHAIYLWEVSFQKREDWIAKQAHMKLLRAKAEKAEAEAKFPKPKKFPVFVDEFLLLTLPEKRPEDRMKLFRDLIRLNIRVGKQYSGQGGSVIPFERIPETTDSELTQTIDRLRQRGYDEDGFKFAFQSLRQFADFQAKKNRQKRSKAGADAKWKKQPPEK
jgi:hypothetical protein